MSEYKSTLVKKKYHKPLAELNWLFDKWSENFFTFKHQIYSDKIENWLKAHDDIPAYEIPHEMMKNINTFDMKKYGKIKLRFQGK